MKRIYYILEKWKREARAGGVIQFKFNCITGHLKVYTSHPGWLIGKAGYLVEKYRIIFKEKIPEFKTLEIIETDNYFVK